VHEKDGDKEAENNTYQEKERHIKKMNTTTMTINQLNNTISNNMVAELFTVEAALVSSTSQTKKRL
jgi:hypothetical protein